MKLFLILVSTLLFLIIEILLGVVVIFFLGMFWGFKGNIANILSAWISVFLSAGGASFIAAVTAKKYCHSIKDRHLLLTYLVFTLFWNGLGIVAVQEPLIRLVSVVLALAAIFISYKLGWKA